MSTTEIAATNWACEETIRKGDVDRLSYLYTPDAIALLPGALLAKGREAGSLVQPGGSFSRASPRTLSPMHRIARRTSRGACLARVVSRLASASG